MWKRRPISAKLPNPQSIQLVNLTTHHPSISEDDSKKIPVFSIFQIAVKDDSGIITQPIQKVTTCEYNLDYKIAYSLIQEKNTRKDQNLEDEVYIRQYIADDDSVFIASVLDGHEGRDAADYVRDNLFDILAEKLLKNPEDITDEVKQIFQEVDSIYCRTKTPHLQSILRPPKRSCFCGHHRALSDHENYYLGCGCVLTLICIHNNQLILAGLGDCGIVFSSCGRARYSLVRHNPTLDVEAQRIISAGGTLHGSRVDGRIAVSRSIGDVWYKESYHFPQKNLVHQQDILIAEPDVKIYPLSGDLEFCILASDGLFANISYQSAINTVKDFIIKGRTGEEACRELVNRARTKTQDDISVVILFFHIEKHEKTHIGMLTDDTSEYRALSDGEEDNSARSILAYNRGSETMARSLSDVNLSVYSTRQSTHKEYTKTTMRELFSRRRPSVNFVFGSDDIRNNAGYLSTAGTEALSKMNRGQSPSASLSVASSLEDI